jgi:hypothetical protein
LQHTQLSFQLISERSRAQCASAFISSADSALRAVANSVLSDENKTVQQRHEKHKTLSLVEVKAAILPGALRTSLVA